MSEIVNGPEDLAAFPDFTVIVSAPAEVNGRTAVIAIQKIGGEWVAIGTPFPLSPEMINKEFYPGEVVYRLQTAGSNGGLG